MEVKEDGKGRQKEAMCMRGRGASVKEVDVRGVSVVRGARVVRAWCGFVYRMYVQASPDSFSLLSVLSLGGTDTQEPTE